MWIILLIDATNYLLNLIFNWYKIYLGKQKLSSIIMNKDFGWFSKNPQGGWYTE